VASSVRYKSMGCTYIDAIIGRPTCDQEVASSMPGQGAAA